ncbi:GatB/YqeY domain-containing protein [bacterium]|nr:GatB/YqeY domain-containing protein [bacterium]
MHNGPVLEQLFKDMKDALRAGDKLRLGVIRLLRAQLENVAIQRRRELTEDEILSVFSSAVKMRKEAIEKFREGNRQDLVEKELAELNIVQGYLPQPLSEEEVSVLVDKTVREVGASGLVDLGTVMKQIMPQVRGRVEGGLVNKLVKEKLQNL